MSKIIIIGAGLAGLSATVTACENENEVILVSTMPSERAQSVMAEGGINGALNTKKENDSVEEHFNDTFKAGVYLSNPNAVKSLTYNAPKIINKLASCGVIFNRDENGNIDLRNFGGQKKKRTAFAKSSTGKQIMTSIIQKVRKYENEGLVTRYDNHYFFELIKDENEICNGCILLDKDSKELIPIISNSVIIASGGMHGLFKNTTGSLDNKGIVTANLFTSNVLLANCEFIQYHPTTLKFSNKHLLISEAARGEGGRLFYYENGDKKYFMEEKYPEMGNLMPRDIISKEIWNILNQGIETVYLDLTEIPKNILNSNLLDVVEDCKTFFNIDPSKEPIPVTPGIHYFMGGIEVDEFHRTNIIGLYAAGECACQYHGANRLGGNSLLGAIYGGEIAAKTAIKDDNKLNKNCEVDKIILDKTSKLKLATKKKNNNSLPVLKYKLNNILENSLGIIRNQNTLEKGLKELNEFIEREVKDNYDSTSNIYENINFENQCILGKTLIECAILRKESRGAHNRSDFPEINDEKYKKTTIAKYNGNYSVNISFKEILELKQ
ncbi:FAD-binding protein [Methanobrevibacter sp. DSM 116169]|uniref:FAD-binding protein n=1 Tax=Methanobrevibacter sp. DSM 116169 TaxID=3242727 RepID=UPI0038FC5E6A